MPDHLLGACTTLNESLQICRERQPTLLITTQLLEQGSGLELITAAKQLLPDLRSLLFLQYEHRTLLEQAVKTHSDGIVLDVRRHRKLDQRRHENWATLEPAQQHRLSR